ncbi:MAG TPA: TolC family protein [Thermoanaerobaculia bacterium]|nr:TolC family protein [Thermoanaerobaculia bacterium]
MKRLLFAVFLTGCASTAPHPGTSDAPAKPWTPPANVVPPPVPVVAKTDLPATYTPGMAISLAQVIDIALSNNPDTRIAWLQARAAEADLGSAKSEYLPQIDLNASVVHSRGNGLTYGPSLALSYLLFDFGGREAFVEEARQALIAADFLHNQAIQDVIFQTQQAYYGYLDAKALLAAQEATIKERRTSLDAAEARHRAGIATIADVLQARTALSQATLNRDTIEGNLRTIEGLLATTMGLPATTRFDFGELPLEIPARQVTETVDALIARAVEQRPDLAASRARAEQARARVQEVRAQGLPTISVASSVGYTRIGTRDSNTPYSAGVSLRFPLFTGFRNTYDIRAAEARAQVAGENVRALEQDVNLQVWTSYYALQTATTRLATARDLLASAQQSADVAADRYKAGVGSILDLLTAESALESARAQEVQARTDWFVAVAQLAHDTGSLK